MAKQMPDFEVNEGYMEAGRRRADSPMPGSGGPSERMSETLSAVSSEDLILDEWLTSWYELTGDEDRPSEVSVEAAPQAPAADEERRLPEETPIVRRTRHRPDGHLAAGGTGSGRRVGVRLIARRRRLSRRACPYGCRVHILGTPPRGRRRLWTGCHGRRPSLPGSR
jgi:hypothetical protein